MMGARRNRVNPCEDADGFKLCLLGAAPAVGESAGHHHHQLLAVAATAWFNCWLGFCRRKPRRRPAGPSPSGRWPLSSESVPICRDISTLGPTVEEKAGP